MARLLAGHISGTPALLGRRCTSLSNPKADWKYQSYFPETRELWSGVNDETRGFGGNGTTA